MASDARAKLQLGGQHAQGLIDTACAAYADAIRTRNRPLGPDQGYFPAVADRLGITLRTLYRLCSEFPELRRALSAVWATVGKDKGDTK